MLVGAGRATWKGVMMPPMRLQVLPGRGFTLFELLVVVTILGVLGIFTFRIVAGSTSGLGEENAQRWAAALGYEHVRITCQNMIGKDRCTVAVPSLARPLSVDCSHVTRQCALTRAFEH